MNLGLALYRLVGRAAFPFLKGSLAKSHPDGVDERCGRYDPEKLRQIEAAVRGGGNLWVHAVSVGEAQAASPLVRVARAEGYGGAITVSTVTPTGARNARALIGPLMTEHIYAPWDVPAAVRCACDALRPDLYVTMETEVWPALLSELRSRMVPRVLANARVSDRTWARARRNALNEYLVRTGYGLFDLVLARTDADASRVAAFGVDERKIVVVGDMKVDAILWRRGEALAGLDALRARLGLDADTTVFVAGSTHEGEDEILLEAFSNFLKRYPNCTPRLIIAPRHPERASAVCVRAATVSSAAVLSDVSRVRDARIVVIDEIGLLYDLYGLAAVAFVGGSLLPKGGQNILEPASWGVPILHGPYMDDFAEPTAALDASGEAYRVENAEDIAAFWARAMSGDLGRVGGSVYFDGRAGAAARAWAEISELMG